MTTASLSWLASRDTATGSVAATIDMDEAAWTTSGASFVEVDDDLGGQARLAVGELELEGTPVQFGVIAYSDDDVSHLVVGGPYDERPVLTARIVDGLIAAGVISTEELVLEIIGLTKPASTEEKLDYLAGVVETQHRQLAFEMRLLREQLAAVGSEPETGVSERHASAALAVPWLVHSDLRQLLTMRGRAYTSDREADIVIRGPAPVFEEAARLAASSGPDRGPAARLMSFDVASGQAIVVMESTFGSGRMVLVLDGLFHEPVANDLIAVYFGSRTSPEELHWNSLSSLPGPTSASEEPFGPSVSPARRTFVSWLRFRIER
jgi:hypothetical protein